MARKIINKRETFYVVLPEGVDVEGYSGLKLTGQTTNVSARGAVASFIARQDQCLVSLVMHKLDSHFGGAESYSFRFRGAPPQIEQPAEDLRDGGRMNPYERRILKDHAFANELARRDNANTLDTDVKFKYLSLARYLMKEAGRVR